MLRSALTSSPIGNGEWLVELSCGHAQASQAEPAPAAQFECPSCDRFELPPYFTPYKQTPLFDENTVPAGILNEHSTKAGVWAKIHVVEGRLRYRVPALRVERDVEAGHIDIVVPEVVHNVQPLGPVKFYVEFHKAP